MVNAYSDNYLKNQIDTASQEQLLIMFYDGAISFVSRASLAIDDNNIEQRNYCINKTSAIISELSATLDHKIGGKIADDLYSLYDYMNRELIKANINNDKNSLDIVKNLLSDLRETWKEAIDLNRKVTAPSARHKENLQSFSVSY